MASETDTSLVSEVNSLVTARVTAGSYPDDMELRGDTPAARLAYAMEQRGINQPDLARLTGTTKQTVHKIVSGTNRLSPEWAQRFGKALVVSPEALLFGTRPAAHNRENAAGRLIEIVELDVRAAAGSGLESVDQPPEVARWTIPKALVESITTAPAQRLRVITVYGDSMEPTFPAGCRVMVDTEDRRPSPPGVFVVWDGVGLVVKRLEYIPDAAPPVIRLISDNTRYSSRDLPVGDVHIQGRVIGRWQWT